MKVIDERTELGTAGVRTESGVCVWGGAGEGRRETEKKQRERPPTRPKSFFL